LVPKLQKSVFADRDCEQELQVDLFHELNFTGVVGFNKGKLLLNFLEGKWYFFGKLDFLNLMFTELKVVDFAEFPEWGSGVFFDWLEQRFGEVFLEDVVEVDFDEEALFWGEEDACVLGSGRVFMICGMGCGIFWLSVDFKTINIQFVELEQISNFWGDKVVHLDANELPFLWIHLRFALLVFLSFDIIVPSMFAYIHKINHILISQHDCHIIILNVQASQNNLWLVALLYFLKPELYHSVKWRLVDVYLQAELLLGHWLGLLTMARWFPSLL
jgi:hypothetical protein